MAFTHLNIFSGAGGFELAAEVVGWKNVASCEINRYARQLLHSRFGHTVHHDATDTDFRKYRGAIDVLSMSPPCQAHSTAGNRLSRLDDRDLLHICPGILDAVRPRVCVLENVSGLLTSESGLAIRELIASMERAGDGYTVLPLHIPAGAGGALHQRYRVFLVAYAHSQRRQSSSTESFSSPAKTRRSWVPHLDPHAARRAAAGQAGFLGIYDGLPGPLDRRPGQKLRLMGNAVSPYVTIPLFQAIDAALRATL